jgi:predicted N-acetyltransferase YhbS
MITDRHLSRDEIRTVWTIDRSEIVDSIYRLENGALVPRAMHIDVSGWPPGESEKYTPILEACFDRGGWFHGLFDDESMIGVAVLDSRFIGKDQDTLQLKFLHVGRAHRDRGFGRRLFRLAGTEAIRLGAARLYVSATPSRHTIDFYLGLGCQLATEPDAELFELEPEDIHLEFDLARHLKPSGGAP